MEMPMAPQQQQQGQQHPIPQGQQGQKPFPSDYGEAKQFSNDLKQVLYDDTTHDNIIKQISRVGEDKPQGVGMIVANVIGDRVGDVRAQSNRPIEMKLVAGAARMVIEEIAEIAENSGAFEMAPEEKQGAMEIAVSILDDMSRGQNGS